CVTPPMREITMTERALPAVGEVSDARHNSRGNNVLAIPRAPTCNKSRRLNRFFQAARAGGFSMEHMVALYPTCTQAFFVWTTKYSPPAVCRPRSVRSRMHCARQTKIDGSPGPKASYFFPLPFDGPNTSGSPVEAKLLLKVLWLRRMGSTLLLAMPPPLP